ncbi:MAG: CDP-glucose 4,6-dehydratase [Verrucomicrobia bacterium]|nr:CDP-glucose 4,6-dehydratase [Verrucomicrobiota bacterium]
MAFDNVYDGLPVLLTGDTGFKGSWLAWWLRRLGAEVRGLALPPEQPEGPYLLAGLSESIIHTDADIRDEGVFDSILAEHRPRAVFHLAAQPIVRESYVDPVGTVDTNVLGTARLLDAVNRSGLTCAVVVVTSDKCYENREMSYSYRETDPMGGHDVYSASKGCAELIVSAFRRSFFSGHDSPVRVASARAGNVIGPGDWAVDRIIPDAMRSLFNGEAIPVRNPHAVRPWQHVLEPLAGYLEVGRRLMGDDGSGYAEGWNFGPRPESCRNVEELVTAVLAAWGEGKWKNLEEKNAPHEATLLTLSIEKASAALGWEPVWSFEESVEHTVRGYRELRESVGSIDRAGDVLSREIEGYTEKAKSAGIRWAE